MSLVASIPLFIAWALAPAETDATTEPDAATEADAPSVSATEPTPDGDDTAASAPTNAEDEPASEDAPESGPEPQIYDPPPPPPPLVSAPFEPGSDVKRPLTSPSRLPNRGVAPLSGRGAEPPTDGTTPTLVEQPLGDGPPIQEADGTPPKNTPMVRVDLRVGPVWRIEEADTLIHTGVEFGRMQGFSASFHTAMIVASDRTFVQAFDFPIGVGALAQGRLANRLMYGSVGLTAGILVHRASTEQGVVHRVDPDLRVPLRLAWTLAGIGISFAVVPAYSVRERSYERRGAIVWNRHSFRVGFQVGLHWDRTVGPTHERRKPRRRGRS